MNTTDTSSSIQFPAIIRSMKAVDMYYKSTKNGLTGTHFKNPSYQKGTLYNQAMTYRKCKSTFLLIQKCLPLSQINILSINKEQLLLIIVFVFASYGHKAKLMFSTSFKGSKQIILKRKTWWCVLHYRTSKQSQVSGHIVNGVSSLNRRDTYLSKLGSRPQKQLKLFNVWFLEEHAKRCMKLVNKQFSRVKLWFSDIKIRKQILEKFLVNWKKKRTSWVSIIIFKSFPSSWNWRESFCEKSQGPNRSWSRSPVVHSATETPLVRLSYSVKKSNDVRASGQSSSSVAVFVLPAWSSAETLEQDTCWSEGWPSPFSCSRSGLSSDETGGSCWSTAPSLFRLWTSPLSEESPSLFGGSVCMLLASEDQSNNQH